MPERGLIVLVDDATTVDWELAKVEYGAVVLLPVGRVTRTFTVTVEKARRAFGREHTLDSHQPFTPQTLADAVRWLREDEARAIELRAEPRHWDAARVAMSFAREAGVTLTDLDGVPSDAEAREHRPRTTSTLLIIAADAVFPDALEPLGPFEQLIADELGWERRGIPGTRCLAGWERRVAMLCGGVRPAITAVLASPHPEMHRAAARVITAVPHVGKKDAKTLEEWDSDTVINTAGRIVDNAKSLGGRGPKRIVIVVRESHEWVQDALSRAAWMLDEARVEIVAVDPLLGLLERDVTLFWDEADAAAHAANLAAILAEREETGPL